MLGTPLQVLSFQITLGHIHRVKVGPNISMPVQLDYAGVSYSIPISVLSPNRRRSQGSVHGSTWGRTHHHAYETSKE